MRTVAEHPLLLHDLVSARQQFAGVDFRTYHLLVLLAVPLRRTPLFAAVKAVLGALDDGLLRLPGVKQLGWIEVIERTGPRVTA